jgi:hypothetical protein
LVVTHKHQSARGCKMGRKIYISDKKIILCSPKIFKALSLVKENSINN